MKLLMENWRKFLKEQEEGFKPHTMYDPETGEANEAQSEEEHNDLAAKGLTHIDPSQLEKVLRDEGGASGMEPFEKAMPDEDPEEIKKTLTLMPDVGQHEDGDYILSDDSEIEINEEEGKKDACYHKVKSRYKVWPSAYASGALVKCRKVGAANWGEGGKKKKK